MLKHLKIIIYGQVQGVGFRWSAYEKFVDLGLTGKAENGSDRTVEIDVQGDDYQLEKLIDWCYKGPMGAKVTKVEVTEIQNEHANPDNQNQQN
jgi:acylphosphatase